MIRKLIIVFILIIFAAASFLVINKPKHRLRQEDSGSSGQEIDPGAVQPANKLFDLAKRYEAENEFALSRETYQKILRLHPDYPQIQEAQKHLEDVNLKIIFSPTLITAESQYYEVKPGDTLSKIAKKFDTTVELIKKINMLKSDLIRPGMNLKIWKGKFSALVDKSLNILMLKSNEAIVKTYIVATGKNNSTPVGTFKIINKLVDPVWFKPQVGAMVPADSPENILGSRWMGFDAAGYGIHGTTEPEALGSQVTQGCVRMKNEDVEELFSFLPQGTEVTIID
ncbi:MAG: hypothetical protein COV72_04535 [Candidatus Omnitrophica bacterium CG11_big_fil_rev_8_21_14_0_20_42_13]|uniref:LysM domain-containing protein n=1 Tax=Candidatus Ghiorseimicrobium undicola TaxID=1974746 RepID=A0A2H0LXM4_9BACT|nr:MAG: hypothetical protein COV72_04535 [Candidatus Omnitrophica bacterium CG11_big_fil_rev_8_21_14_0_20_42_13]